MKKRVLLLISSLLIVGLLIACPPQPAPQPAPPPAPVPVVPAPEVFTWKTQSSYGLGTWDFKWGENFAKRIEEVSGGRLKLTPVLAPGTIVPAFEILDAVDKGVLDAGFSWAGYWIGKDTAFGLFASPTAGPFGMDIWDFWGWVFEGGGYKLYRDLFVEIGYKNVIPFAIWGEIPEPQGWFKKPVKTWEELKGIKFRAAGLAAMVFKEAGMAVTIMPAAEIAPALEKGLIDAAEYSDPHSDLLLGLMHHAKFYHIPGIHQPTGIGDVLIHKPSFEKLPPDLKLLVEVVANEMILINWVKNFEFQLWALEELITKHGVTIVPTPEEFLLEFIKAWDKIAAAESAKNPRFAKIYESQKAWASKIVPFKRLYFPDYALAADYYWKK